VSYSRLTYIRFQGRCEVCRAEFPSRSKLFDHLKAEGHAKIIQGTQSVDNASSKPGKKNKKQKGK